LVLAPQCAGLRRQQLSLSASLSWCRTRTPRGSRACHERRLGVLRCRGGSATRFACRLRFPGGPLRRWRRHFLPGALVHTPAGVAPPLDDQAPVGFVPTGEAPTVPCADQRVVRLRLGREDPAVHARLSHAHGPLEVSHGARRWESRRRETMTHQASSALRGGPCCSLLLGAQPLGAEGQPIRVTDSCVRTQDLRSPRGPENRPSSLAQSSDESHARGSSQPGADARRRELGGDGWAT
jgi:hypothetical protein